MIYVRILDANDSNHLTSSRYWPTWKHRLDFLVRFGSSQNEHTIINYFV